VPDFACYLVIFPSQPMWSQSNSHLKTFVMR